jgi:dTDP-4-amino-4,6-dideoxygalactose transaminase
VIKKKFGMEQPWPFFCEEQIQIATDVLRSGKVNYWTGSQGKLFEQEFADYIGVKYAIALANGTLAIELALIALGIGSGDEVIVPSRTYIATAGAVVIRGAEPVVADIDLISGNVNVSTIEKVRTSRTRAIIVVHLGGWPCDMPAIMAYAKEHGLLVIEDCAQAHGASYEGRKVGSFGDAAAFSFCQDKIMSTGGEGGMVVFRDRDNWSRAWSFKDHGRNFEKVYSQDHSPGFRWLNDSFGSNYRMTELQASIGRFQLRKLDEWVVNRQRLASVLDSFFDGCSLLRQAIPPENIVHARYRYYTYIKTNELNDSYSRERIIGEFAEYGIPCSSGSCSEIYLEKAFVGSGFSPETRYHCAKELGETSLVFLVDPTLTEDDMQYICDVSKEIFGKAGR